MKITIRIAVREDVSVIADLLSMLMTHHGESPPPRPRLEQAVQSIIASPGSWYLVAEGNDGIMGILQVSERFSSWAGATYGVIEDVCVRQAWRSHGVGGKLIAEVQTWMHDKGWARLDLDVLEDNHRARAFYEQNGFHDTGYRVYRVDAQANG